MHKSQQLPTCHVCLSFDHFCPNEPSRKGVPINKWAELLLWRVIPLGFETATEELHEMLRVWGGQKCSNLIHCSPSVATMFAFAKSFQPFLLLPKTLSQNPMYFWVFGKHPFLFSNPFFSGVCFPSSFGGVLANTPRTEQGNRVTFFHLPVRALKLLT